MVNVNIDSTVTSTKKNIDYIEAICEQEYSKYIGNNVMSCYFGNAVYFNTREAGASGGTVTAIAQAHLLLNYKNIALLQDGNEYRLYNQTDILKLPQGSHYGNREFGLPMHQINGNVLIVCLPCQVRYYRHLLPEATIIGLFCSHRIKPEGLRLLTNNQPYICRYKYNRQTGLLYNNIFISSDIYWSKLFNFCYIPEDCFFCKDMTAEKADISIGDAHRHIDFSLGKNSIITRTEKGEILLQNAIELGLLEATETNPFRLINTQSYLPVKKGSTAPKIRIYKLLRNISCYMSNHKAFGLVMKLWIKYIQSKGVKIVNG